MAETWEATHVWHGHAVRLIGSPRWIPGGIVQDVANVGGELDGLHYAVVADQLRVRVPAATILNYVADQLDALDPRDSLEPHSVFDHPEADSQVGL